MMLHERSAPSLALGHIDLADPITKHVSKDFATVQAQHSVGEALAALRGQELAQKIVYFYVIDAAGKLVGVLPTRRLLMSPPEATVASIMVPRVVAIPAAATVGDACEFFILHRFLAFPVVDAERKLLGTVDVGVFTDEVFDLAERRSVEDVFQLIGVHLAQGRTDSTWASFKSRFPWLLCNIGGGLACAVLSSHYESLLSAVVALALFVPVVLALAESVSMQSMTITVHALHEDSFEWGRFLTSLGRELRTALLLALGCASVVASVVWLWKRTPAVALTVGGAIGLSVVTACLLGVLLPTAVRAVRGDPRIAAGPIVLATADLATLVFYFNLAGRVLGS